MGNGRINSTPCPELMEGSAIRNLSFEQSGAIRAELDARSGGVLYYLPLMRHGQIEEWRCVSQDYPEIQTFLPQCEYMDTP
jgi:Ni,Fe-hydrogenase III large subunit